EHSAALRAGLAETLSILARHADVVSLATGRTGQEWANTVVRRVLGSILSVDDWASLCDQLPRLAEAAPEEVLDAVERDLAGPKHLHKIFEDRQGQNPIHSSSPHTGLLWAIEGLMWSRDHLPRAALCMARIAEI